MSLMVLKTIPIWHEGVTFPATHAAHPLPAHTDVAIIGGGYTGLAAARTLARHGIAVTVLEARSLAWGASSRNAGMALTGLSRDVGTLVARYGVDTTRRLFAASLEAIACLEQVIREEAIAGDFVRCGHLFLAARPRHFAALQHEAAVLARVCNHPTRVISRNDLSAEIGSEAFYGGLIDDASASIHPARYAAGLACAAQRAGAWLFDHTSVAQITRAGSVFCITTSRGSLRAHNVLVATNGYTGRATPALQRRMLPFGSYIITTGVLPEALAWELNPHNRMLFDSRRLLAYFRLTPDRRLLFGGRTGSFRETPAAIRRSAAILRREMVRVYPQLRAVPVEYAWGGTVGIPFDRLPHAGQLDGLYYALGYAGHGVAFATYLGTRIAEWIAGVPSENPFADLPLPKAPFGLYNGTPWFIPLVGTWYRLLDWID